MADFPTSVYSPRTIENRNGVTYDASKKKVLYAEDIQKLNDEVVAIETYLEGDRLSFGTAQRATGTASGNQTIAHGLGAVPRIVRIKAIMVLRDCISFGIFDGTNVRSLSAERYDGNSFISSTKMIEIYDMNTGGTQLATISIDSTNITLAWVKSGTLVSDNISMLWEAEL